MFFPFDNMNFAVSGEVWLPLTGLTTPVEGLSLPQLTGLIRSAIVVSSKFLVAFMCCHVALWIFLSV